MEEVGRALACGFVLTFDYGYPAEELYAPWRRDGTLLCFYRHNPSTDPYARLGRQDMTAHVDFTTLVETGRRQGLEPLGITTQTRFLAALGIGAGLSRAAGDQPLALEEYYARRRAVLELIDTAGLGRIRVLIQEKGVGPCELWGLVEMQPAEDQDG
jgi:SAM-dependent MidA family methyltransferase